MPTAAELAALTGEAARAGGDGTVEKARLADGPPALLDELRTATGASMARHDIAALLSLSSLDPWIAAALEAIARAVSSVRWEVFRDGKRERGTRLETLLRHPNKFQCWEDLIGPTAKEVAAVGESLWEMVREGGEGSRVVGLWRRSPGRYEPVGDPVEYVAGFRYLRRSGADVTIPADDAVWFKNWSITNELRGQSGLVAARNFVILALQMVTWNKRFFENGALPEGAFRTNASLTPDDYKRIREQLRERLSGIAQRSPLILEGGMEFTPIGTTQDKLQFLEGLEFAREAALASLGVPPAVIGVVRSGTLGSAREQRHQFYANTILPLLRKIESTVTARLGGDGLEFRFDLNDILTLTEDMEARQRQTESLLGRGVQTINELRADMGLEPVDWGERPWMPLGLAPVEAPGRPKRPEGLGLAPAEEEKSHPEAALEIDDRTAKRIAVAAIWKARVRSARALLAGVWRLAMGDVRRRILAALDARLGAVAPGEAPVAKAEFDIPIAEVVEAVGEKLRGVHRKIMEENAGAAAGEVRAGFRLRLPADDPRFARWFDEWRARRAEPVVGALAERTREAVRRMTDEGREPAEIRREVERIMGEFAGRAEELGQTDAVDAGNAGREIGFAEAGARWKQWLSVQIETTRRREGGENHFDRYPEGAHEQIVPAGSAFILRSRGGATVRAAHPGASGDPSNDLNCLCTSLAVDEEEARAAPELVPPEYRA